MYFFAFLLAKINLLTYLLKQTYASLTPKLKQVNQLPLNNLHNPISLLQQINIKQNNDNTEQY